MQNRRCFLKGTAAVGAGFPLPGLWTGRRVSAMSLADGLSDPALQPKFVEAAPNALDPGFLFKDLNVDRKPVQKPNFSIRVAETVQQTGLVDPTNGRRLDTPVSSSSPGVLGAHNWGTRCCA
jgi:spore coat protein A